MIFAVEEEAEVHEADCSIEDRYVISHKDATLIRQISYTNNSVASYPLELPAYPIKFFLHCEDFEIKINDAEVRFRVKEEDYSKIVRIDNSCEIEPHGALQVVIKCKWKNFASYADNCFFVITYPDKAKYTLTIEDIDLLDKKYVFLRNGLIAKEETDFVVGPTSIRFKQIDIDINKSHKIELLILSTPKNLATLSYYVNDKANEGKFDGFIIFVIQHLLSDFVHIAEAFTRAGVSKDHLFITGIPYSTKEKTVKYLQLLGYRNIKAPTSYPFDETCRVQLADAIRFARSTGKRILIVEDGGYAVPMVHEEFVDEIGFFLGAVEQTANGIWRDRDTHQKIGLKFPVINVAESKIKDQLESPLIGRAVCKNLENLMGKQFTDISGKDIGLVGFGRTGSRIAEVLRSMGGIVTVYSNDKIDLARALTEGYRVSGSYVELLTGSAIVIEATGQIWGGRDEIMAFRHGSWFISASSKRLGINYEEFERLVDDSKTLNITGIGKRYELRDEKAITLVGDGYPINFFDSESVPDKKIAFIPTLLFMGAVFLVNKETKIEKGIVNMDDNDDLKSLAADIADVHFKHWNS